MCKCRVLFKVYEEISEGHFCRYLHIFALRSFEKLIFESYCSLSMRSIRF